MNIKNYILNSYPTAHPFTGTNSVENKLFEKKYIVLIDNDNEFKGILTPCDLIKRPRKILIDCITEKKHISSEETILTALDKFNDCQVSALPVFEKNKFIGIVEKYDLIRRAKEKINELYQKSLISEKAKLSFIDCISHEIRTPLNGILGFIEIISKLDPEDFRSRGAEHSSVIRKCTDKFLITMNDLIDLALIHAGDSLETEISEFYIEDIFYELKEYFVTEAKLLNLDISLSYENKDKLRLIASDKSKIKHILYHLIDNGIKFSYDKKVHYTCTLADTNLTFYVSNAGPIIGDDIKERIFNYFEKPDILNAGFINGLGIGLPLVQKLTELLNGNLSFISTNNSTVFSCSVPVKVLATEFS